MRGILRVFRAWFPAIAWMIMIFLFSSRQRISVADEQVINFLFFKSIHVIEYAILYALVLRAIITSSYKNKDVQQMYISAIIICILYAVSDEIHQTFIPTREGAIRDVFIDTLGMLIMYTFIKNTFKVIKKYI